MRFLTTSGWSRRGTSSSPRGSSSRTCPSATASPRRRGPCRRRPDELRRVRLGHPRAVDRAGLERGERRGVVLRDDRDVTAAVLGRSCSPSCFSQVRSATSCVLPSDGVASFLPLRSAALVIDGFTTRNAPPDAAPDTMRISVPFDLLVGVDRGVRADERGVERAGLALASAPADRRPVRHRGVAPPAALRTWSRSTRSRA